MATKLLKTPLTYNLLYQKYIKEEVGAQAIANETGWCKTTILTALHKFNIPCRPTAEHAPKGKPTLTYDILYQKYVNEKKTQKEIAKELRRHLSTINEKLQKFNIKSRRALRSEELERQFVDVDVGNIGWEYIGGFFDADGAIYRWHYVRRIVFANTDEQVLRMIRKFFGTGYLYKRKKSYGHFGNKPIFELATTRKDVVDQLARYVILNKEKFNEIYGVQTPTPKITWKYVAGFFDGEGSITAYTHPWVQFKLAIVNNNLQILLQIKNLFEYGSIYNHGKNCYVLRVDHHKPLLDIGKKLLPFCIVKRQKLQYMVDIISKKEWHKNYKLTNISKEELVRLYWNEMLSLRQIAKKFNVQYSSIHRKFKILEIPVRHSNRKKESGYD